MDKKLKSHFLSLYCMIVADGDIDEKELCEMYRIAQENYGLSKEEIDKAVLNGGNAFYIPEDNTEKIIYLYHLALIAAADGIIDESEIILLRKYAEKFGFIKENIPEIVEVLLDYAKKKVPETQLINEIK